MASKQCSHLASLWSQYTKHPSNNLALELAHTIDTLVDNYDTRLDYSSVYNVVCEMLSDYTISANCVSRLLRIIAKFIECVHVRAALVSGLQAGLSQQILYRYNQQPADSLIRLCLEQLRDCILDVTVCTTSSSTNDLLKLLTRLILKKNGPLLDVSLSVLGNLCRNNLIMQANIKSMDCIRAVYQQLMYLLGHSDMGVIVHALSLFTSLCLNEELGSKAQLFVGNVCETFQLVFNILRSEELNTQVYSINLLIDFSKAQNLLTALETFPELDKNLDAMSSLLVDSPPLLVSKIAELYSHLSTNPNIYSKILTSLTSAGDNAPLKALLSLPLREPFLSSLRVMLPDLLEACEEYRDSVVDKLVRVIETIPLHTPHQTVEYRTVSVAAHCLSDLYKVQCCQQLVYHRLGGLVEQINAWLDSAPDPYKDSFSEECCGAITNLAHLAITTSHTDTRLALSHPHLSWFLGQALLASDRRTVSTALTVSSLVIEHNDQHAFVVSDMLAKHSQHLHSNTYDAREQVTKLQSRNQELQRQNETLLRKLSDNSISQPLVQQPVTQVTEIIDKMTEGLQLNDLRASELLEIFEQKVAYLTTKSEHMSDLLETKSMALEQCDRLCSQFKNRVAQAEVECTKYKALLQQAEREAQEYQGESCALLKAQKEMACEMEGLREDLSEAAQYQPQYAQAREEVSALREQCSTLTITVAELRESVEGLSERAEMLTNHNETLKNQHECAVSQVQVLEKEKAKVVSKLEEKDSLYLKTKQSLRQTEDKFRKKEKEKIDVEAQLKKRQNELLKSEQLKNELSEKVSMLEIKGAGHVKELEEQSTKLALQAEEISKHAQLKALIHNLSGGKGT